MVGGITISIDVSGITDRLDAAERTQAEILTLLKRLFRLEVVMSAELDALTVQVAKNTDVEAGAVVLIKGIKAALDAAGTDPVKLNDLKASLDSSASALAQAILENTPAQP